MQFPYRLSATIAALSLAAIMPVMAEDFFDGPSLTIGCGAAFALNGWGYIPAGTVDGTDAEYSMDTVVSWSGIAEAGASLNFGAWYVGLSGFAMKDFGAKAEYEYILSFQNGQSSTIDGGTMTFDGWTAGAMLEAGACRFSETWMFVSSGRTFSQLTDANFHLGIAAGLAYRHVSGDPDVLDVDNIVPCGALKYQYVLFDPIGISLGMLLIVPSLDIGDSVDDWSCIAFSAGAFMILR